MDKMMTDQSHQRYASHSTSLKENQEESSTKDSKYEKNHCQSCGIRTHEFKRVLFRNRMVPLTIPGRVLRGRCLRCHPLGKGRYSSTPIIPPNQAGHVPNYIFQVNPKHGDSNEKVAEKSEESFMVPNIDICSIIMNMTSHWYDEEIQEESCSDLWQLAKIPDLSKAIADAGGINAIVGAMKAHPRVPTVQTEACAALFSLAKNPVVNHQIGYSGAILVITRAMKLHPYSKDVQKEACATLFILSKTPQNLKLFRLEQPQNLLIVAAKRFPSECVYYTRVLLDAL